MKLLPLLNLVLAKQVTYSGKPDDNSEGTMRSNAQILSQQLQSLLPGDVFVIPQQTFSLIGGVSASNLNGVKIVIDGTLSFSNKRSIWPVNSDGKVLQSIQIDNLKNSTITSTSKGVINGNGRGWWGAINYLRFRENRPKLLVLNSPKDVVVEKLLLKDAAYWTFWAPGSSNLIVRYVDVDANPTGNDGHSIFDLLAFNTDGIDVTGNNVHIHDCNVHCQDDCFAVKDNSQNMLIERVTCSGLGLTVGSIGNSLVNNVTFRDSYLPNTYKGIYLKTRAVDNPNPNIGITNILYQNITMYKPEQYPIWIGPAQQVGQCDLTWPFIGKCEISPYHKWDNIKLKDVTIIDPKSKYIGNILGNAQNPMQNIQFENVRVQQSDNNRFVRCENVQGTAMNGLVPSCLTAK